MIAGTTSWASGFTSCRIERVTRKASGDFVSFRIDNSSSVNFASRLDSCFVSGTLTGTGSDGRAGLCSCEQAAAGINVSMQLSTSMLCDLPIICTSSFRHPSIVPRVLLRVVAHKPIATPRALVVLQRLVDVQPGAVKPARAHVEHDLALGLLLQQRGLLLRRLRLRAELRRQRDHRRAGVRL